MKGNDIFKKFFFLFLWSIFSIYSMAQIANTVVLDGCTNYLEIPENNQLDFNQAISIECWIKPNCEEGNRIIIAKQWCEGEYGYYLSVNNGKLFWSYSINGYCVSPNTFQSVNEEISFQSFTHVAVVHTLNEIKLFINGIEVISEQNEGIFGLINNSSEPVRIGAYKKIDGEISNFFSGQIDEIRVWDFELTENLIQQRKDISLTGNEFGLILYLNMEQNGQGGSLELQNQSSLGASLNATPIGYTSSTPYIINHQEYAENNLDLGPDIISCNNSVSLSIPVNNYKSILWSNGSSDNTINVTSSGVYVVTVETEMCKFFSDSISVELSDVTFLSNEYNICENDTLTINNNIYTDAGTFYDTIVSPTAMCDTIYEYLISEISSSYEYIQFESCPNSTVFYAGEELPTGSITSFTFTNSNNCDSIVTIEIVPGLVLLEEIYLMTCEGSSILYNDTSLMSNTSTNFYFESEDGCDSIVTVNVSIFPLINNFLGQDTLICGSSHTLISPNENTFWSNGNVSGNAEINSSGTYIATYTNEEGCINSDTITITFVNNNIFIPNVFTPNGDGANDCFQPLFSSNFELSNYNFSIYSRWGEHIFETSNINECWDGRFKNKDLNPGVFIWIIEVNNETCNKYELLKGDITLIK